MQGILLVDKPQDWTSFDVVNYVRKMVATELGKKPRNVKVGHTGTLDPFATGLLILLIGKEYTRQAGEYSKQDKTYEVTMQFGAVSSTGDPEGEITEVNGEAPTREAVEKACQQFVGEIQQIPPAYSAVKVDGQRAYKLARAGREVVIEPRSVTIHKLEVTRYDYPEMQFTTHVSSGTYIRTLVEDIARALQTGAYTTELRRTQIGSFSVADAVTAQNIQRSDIGTLIQTSP